jgi:hypothetical protein
MGQSAWARIAVVMPQPFEVVPNKNNHQKTQVPYYKPKTVWNVFSPCSLILMQTFTVLLKQSVVIDTETI